MRLRDTLCTGTTAMIIAGGAIAMETTTVIGITIADGAQAMDFAGNRCGGGRKVKAN